MQFPFKKLPHLPVVAKKNCSVLKLNAKGEVIRTLMVCLTKTEAEGVARAGNRFFIERGIKDYFRVKEETYA